jgi:hypothetical protein
MRFLTPLLLLATLLAAGPGSAGTVTVTPSTLTVETSRLRLQWDSNYPEALRTVIFKDYNPYLDLAATTYGSDEYWGQTQRDLNDLGFIQLSSFGSQTWQVTAQSASFVEVTITSQSAGQPPVQTRYTVLADQPWFTVDRTILFSVLADTASYQAYVPRMPFLADYRALRWRDPTGTLVQRGFCASPCMTSAWDGHWVQQLTRGGTGQTDLGVTSVYPAGAVSGLPIVRGSGPSYPNGWAQPRVPAGSHTQDRTWSQLVAFTTAPDNLAAIDSLYGAYSSGAALAGVPRGGAAAALRLEVSPNPARGPATLAWTNPVAGSVTLDVLDVAGRRVARLLSGASGAGAQRATWDGRGVRGARVAPGVYLARLVTPVGATTTTIVRAN